MTGSLLGLILAGGGTHAHVRQSRALHNGGHVGKVQIDKAGLADKLRDGQQCLTQHVVGNLEAVGEGDFLIRHMLDAVIGNDHQGIHLVLKVLNALFRLLHPPAALEPEGLCHHAYSENSHLLGGLSHNGCRAGAGAAAPAGGDEHHIGVLQGLGNLAAAFLSGLAANLRVGSGALAVSQLLANLDLIRCHRFVKHLLVRVDRHEVHTGYAGAHHTVYHVIAAAAYADDLDFYDVVGYGRQFNCHVGTPPTTRSGIFCMSAGYETPR